MRSGQLSNSIQSELDKIRVVDSHDHIESYDFARTHNTQIFRLLARSFIEQDLGNVGVMLGRWKATTGGDAEGWLSLKRYIERCRNTTYFRCFLIAVRDLLNLEINELTDENWHVVSHALVAANQREDWYRHVLRERANIDVLLWDRTPTEPEWPNIDNDLFLPTRRFDAFTWIGLPDYVSSFGRSFGREPASLTDVLQLLDVAFQRAQNAGVGAVKIGAAYFRDICFRQSAKADVARIFTAPAGEITREEARAYQDFIYAQIIERCIAHDLTIQVHTGMLATTGRIHDGYPLLLEETISRNPRAKFVLLHGAYPFITQAISLAVKYPNVYLDGSWLPILSPSVYRQAICDWLDALPAERILAWGGDALRVEMAYGSLVIAKKAVTDILAERVEQGHFDEARALRIAHQIFRENARQLFKTDETRDRRLKTRTAASAPRGA